MTIIITAAPADPNINDKAITKRATTPYTIIQ